MPFPQEIEARILELAAERGEGKTICPSEVARSFSAKEPEWRVLMPKVREVAGNLARDGKITVTQGGEPVDVAMARGPVRLGLPETR